MGILRSASDRLRSEWASFLALPLPHRTFGAVCLSFWLIGCITLVSNALLQLSIWVNVAIGCCLAAILGLFWDWQRHRERPPRAMALMLLGLVTLAATWFPNGGVSSSGPLFFIPLTILAAVMLPRRRLLQLLGLALAEFALLCGLEHRFPGWVHPYSSPSQALFDQLDAVAIICLTMGWCVYVLVKAYNQERQRAETASTAKDVFLAQMSHELRTPLNGVIGFSGLLLHRGEDFNPERQQLYLKRIRSHAEHLLALVNQILDFSRGEGGVELHWEELDPRELVAEMTGLMEVLAREKGLRLMLELPESSPMLRTDATRLRQILLNLLGNAVKYTPAGSVICRVLPGSQELKIEIEDSGPGIPAALREAVFEPFYRLAPDDAAPGAGLGLTITRYLCRQLGYGLELGESAQGSGCRCVLTLPLDPEPEPADAPLWQPPVKA